MWMLPSTDPKNSRARLRSGSSRLPTGTCPPEVQRDSQPAPVGGGGWACYDLPMSPKAEKILEEALELPDSARADLAAALLESLDQDVDEDVEAAWSEEIARRIQEVESGAVKPIPWEEARKMIFESRDEAKRR